jgi:short-subunit dehydrogenase
MSGRRSEMTSSITRPLGAVTGASSGIGRSLARQLANHGFDLVIGADEEQIEEAADELRGLGAGVRAVQVDYAIEADVRRFYEAIEQDGRPLVALVLNVGVGLGHTFVEQDLEAALNLVKVNVVCPVLLAKLAIPGMVERGEGRVLFTSSIASISPGPFQALYNASKSFVQSLSEALAEELSGSGVSVTALMPGPTDTDFFNRAGLEDTKLGSGRKDDPDLVAEQGFEAMMAGKTKVVAGRLATKAQAQAMKAVPDKVAAALHASQTEPGSGR